MKKEELDLILKNHNLWIRGEAGGTSADLSYANLHGADLSSASLSGASLSGADLSGANLRYADLSGANLHGADLSGASLHGADLSGANLRYASLSGADLGSADLHGADLRSADLRSASLSGANLSSASLSGANLSGADLPSPTMVLLAQWGNVSETLCLELMRFDAANHPDPSRFDEWAEGGECPYSGVIIQRACNFQERPSLWVPGPAKHAYELMMMLLKEKTK